MEKMKIDMPMRMFLFVVASVMLLGIWLTGFGVIHWILYLPMVFFYFAAIAGICPGMFFTRTIAGKKS